MKQDKFFEILEKNRITLRQYYRLYKGKRDEELTKRGITKETKEGKDIINSVEELFKSQVISSKELMGEDYISKIEFYRKMFPKGNLKSGKPARCSISNLEKTFVWFFKKYHYEWDIIFKATEYYISENENGEGRFMRTSQYFIKKDDTSALADYCEAILNGEDKIEQIKTKVV